MFFVELNASHTGHAALSSDFCDGAFAADAEDAVSCATAVTHVNTTHKLVRTFFLATSS